MEHLLVAFIRASSLPRSSTTPSLIPSHARDIGLSKLPLRLQELVKGYPAVVASDSDLARAGPRKGTRAIRCERMSRIVRAYSKDLVSSSTSWPEDIYIAAGRRWPAWERAISRKAGGPLAANGQPIFTESWERRMRIKDAQEPAFASSNLSSIRGSATRAKSRDSLASGSRRQDLSLGTNDWSRFEEGGFSSLNGRKGSIREKLAFDFTEGARNAR